MRNPEIFEARFQEPVSLAERMAPRDLSDFLGQEHLLGEGKPLRRLIERDRLMNAVFFGPPGTGKTSLARVIARRSRRLFLSLNAATDGAPALKAALSRAEAFLKTTGQKAVLFVDEIHRFNRMQQDLLLPATESGKVIFIGSTVHNPFFAVNKALLSRSLIFEFKPLSVADLEALLRRALEDTERGLGAFAVEVEEGVLEEIALLAEGDARRALNYLEFLFLAAGGEKGVKLTRKLLEEALPGRVHRYGADERYDMISAFIKSIRGSDPDATAYWLVRLLEAGEDPRYLLRRILIHAAEDIGLADPQALVVASSALTAFDAVGRPEGDLILMEAALYLARAPKSNAVLRTLSAAREVVQKEPHYEVPPHLQDASYPGAKRLGRGKGYRYPHTEDASGQLYLPEPLKDRKFFPREEEEGQ